MSQSYREPKVSLQHFRQIGYTKVATKASLDRYPPVTTSEIPEISDYDSDNWPIASSKYGESDMCTKRDIPQLFCLNQDDDIIDLYYRIYPTLDGKRIAHLYLCWELEHRAWEKYGGPNGLKAKLDELHLEHSSSGHVPKIYQPNRRPIRSAPRQSYAEDEETEEEGEDGYESDGFIVSDGEEEDDEADYKDSEDDGSEEAASGDEDEVYNENNEEEDEEEEDEEVAGGNEEDCEEETDRDNGEEIDEHDGENSGEDEGDIEEQDVDEDHGVTEARSLVPEPNFDSDSLRQESVFNIQKMIAVHNLAWPTRKIALVDLQESKKSAGTPPRTPVKSPQWHFTAPLSPPDSQRVKSKNRNTAPGPMQERTPSKTPSRMTRARSSTIKRKRIIESDDDGEAAHSPPSQSPTPLSRKRNRTQ